MDDKSKRGQQDRTRVSASERYEVDYLMKKHSVSREAVEEAIHAAGPSRDAVEAHLAGRKKNSEN